MQTFLPYPDFRASAQVLDRRRLGKQRVEALQVLRGLIVPGYGWRRHPAVRMWDDGAQAQLRARWRYWAQQGKYATQEEGLAWWGRFFAFCAKSKFLTGQSPPGKDYDGPFVASLGWLVEATNHRRIVSEEYHRCTQ